MTFARAFFALGTIGCIALGPSTAGAQEARESSPSRPSSSHPASVRLLVPPCPKLPLDFVTFSALMRIELTTEGIRSADPQTDEGDALIRLDVTPCDENASEVVVAIDNPATGKSIRRVVMLGDVMRDARPRALALAAAELLRSSWWEVSARDAIAAAPVPTPAPATKPAERPEPRAAPQARPAPAAPAPSHWFVGAEAQGRAFFSPGSALFGGRLMVSVPVVRPLRLHFDAGALYGRATDVLGDVDLRLISGALGAAIAAESNAAAVEIGPRIELGWGSASGRPFAASTRGLEGDAFVCNASLSALVRLHLVDRFWALVEPELGGSLRGFQARADNRAPAGIRGPMIGLGLGIAASL